MAVGGHQDRARTFGWIDSMSITQVVQAFEVWPKSSYPFGWFVPVTVTSLLVHADTIHLAPRVSATRIVSRGPIALVTRELLKSGVLSRPAITEPTGKLAVRRTKQRVSRYLSKLRNDYDELLREYSDDAHGWMDWSIRSAWVEHAQNFGGLIDLEFVPQLATILNAPEKDLLDLQRLTSSTDVVTDFVRRQPDTDAFNMTYSCFLLGALLRGVYHDYLATQTGQQVAHHPLREMLLPKIATRPLVYEETDVESYLTNLVLHSALREKNLESRLISWADNIKRIRAANVPGYQEIDLRPKEDPDLALREALRAAKTVGIDFHPRWFEEVVDATFALGVMAGTAGGAFVLDPFPSLALSLALGTATYFISRKAKVGKKVSEGIYAGQGRLSKLAESPPGRISRRRISGSLR